MLKIIFLDFAYRSVAESVLHSNAKITQIATTSSIMNAAWRSLKLTDSFTSFNQIFVVYWKIFGENLEKTLWLLVSLSQWYDFGNFFYKCFFFDV